MYENAIEEQAKDIEELQQNEQLHIPSTIDYTSDKLSLSFEEQEKLLKCQPQTIAAATRIQGITPSSIIRLLRVAKQINSINQSSNLTV